MKANASQPPITAPTTFLWNGANKPAPIIREGRHQNHHHAPISRRLQFRCNYQHGETARHQRHG